MQLQFPKGVPCGCLCYIPGGRHIDYNDYNTAVVTMIRAYITTVVTMRRGTFLFLFLFLFFFLSGLLLQNVSDFTYYSCAVTLLSIGRVGEGGGEGVGCVCKACIFCFFVLVFLFCFVFLFTFSFVFIFVI